MSFLTFWWLVQSTAPALSVEGAAIVVGAIFGLLIQSATLYQLLKRAITGPIKTAFNARANQLENSITTLREEITREHASIHRDLESVRLDGRERETRIATVERGHEVLRQEQAYMKEQLGAQRAGITAIETRIQTLATDLTTAMMAAGRAQSDALHSLTVQFSEFRAAQERERDILYDLQQEHPRRKPRRGR